MDKHSPNETIAPRGRIRDTAGQDQVVATRAPARNRRKLIAAGIGGVVLLGAIA